MKVVEMHFLADVYVPCEVCRGKRFNDATLRVTFKNPETRAACSTSRCARRSSCSPCTRRVVRILRHARRRGPRLRQAGAAFADALGRRSAAHQALARAGPHRYRPHFVCARRADHGLHFEDIRRLLIVLERLVEAGKHRAGDRAQPRRHQVRRCTSSTWDRKGGDRGGLIVATGTPEEVSAGQGEPHRRPTCGASRARRDGPRRLRRVDRIDLSSQLARLAQLRLRPRRRSCPSLFALRLRIETARGAAGAPRLHQRQLRAKALHLQRRARRRGGGRDARCRCGLETLSARAPPRRDDRSGDGGRAGRGRSAARCVRRVQWGSAGPWGLRPTSRAAVRGGRRACPACDRRRRPACRRPFPASPRAACGRWRARGRHLLPAAHVLQELHPLRRRRAHHPLQRLPQPRLLLRRQLAKPLPALQHLARSSGESSWKRA